jgi:PPK2 family polyphosphate:nucleotide phosphotransferase
MPNYRKKLVVKAGSRIRLKRFDPDYHGEHESHKSALPEIEKNRQKLDELQYLMYAEHKHSLLVVLQGLDAGGKDGIVRHVFTGMNPAGCVSIGFKQPTPKELAHDFLWRVHPHVPAKGSVAIFNRSHYEDVLVARVHDLSPEKIWSKRYDEINDFEKLITVQNNTTILKFFLHISKEEQLARYLKNDWMTRRASGRSVNPTTRNAIIGMITSRPSRMSLTRPAPNMLHGSSFLQTTNGLGTWLFHKSLSARWKRWTWNFRSQP